MSNLVYRSRRTQQRNRQSRKLNGNRSRRQKGGAPTEYTIYFNYIVYNRRNIYNNNGKIYITKINEQQEHAMFDSFDTIKRNIDDGIKYQNINLVSLKQLHKSYKSVSYFGVYYHFVLNVIDTQSLPYEQLKNLLKDFMDDNNNFETLEFSQMKELNDSNDYKVDNKYYEVVRAGSTTLPPPPPPPPTVVNINKNVNTSFLSGKDGSLCNGLKSEKDCVGNPSVRKVCQWMPKTKHCQRKASLGSAVFSADSKKSLDDKEQSRLTSAREEYLQSRKSSGDVVSSDTMSSESQASLAAPKKSLKSISRVSTESRACVQKNYYIKTKAGSQYSVDRCILSDDPNVNDTDNCMWNAPTGRCRKVSRR